MKPWKLLNSEFLVDAPWLKVAKETCELPSGKGIGCEQKVYTGAKGMYVVKIGNQAKIVNIK